MQWPPLPAKNTHLRTAVFLGRDTDAPAYDRCWSSPEDSVGIVGPPRYGKTSGLIVPSILMWDGPVVATSTRGDIADATWARRCAVADRRGGDVMVYDPFGSEPGRRSIRWSPLSGCEDPRVCYQRVSAITAVAGGGMQDGDHWRAGAALLLRAYFHAAALEDLPLACVRQWMARQEVQDPAAIIRMSASEARMWADDLEAVSVLGERERGSFYSVARNCLEATAEPTVLRSCSASDLDLDRFLATSSTLFVIGPSHQQQAIAPLLAGLIDSIAHRAAETAARHGGRLPVPLLLALDEVANIAPLQSLPSLVSEGGGRGIVTLWAAQSLAQLRNRYGAEQQAAILAATTAKIIFGGLSNGDDLRNISSWVGEVSETQRSHQSGPRQQSRDLSPPQMSGGTVGERSEPGVTTTSHIYRAALSVDAIQLLPPSMAWLFYRHEPPKRVDARPAGTLPELAALRHDGRVTGVVDA